MLFLTSRQPEHAALPREWEYAAFISYNRAVDGRLAPALVKGLQRFAKPWYRRRALRVFRDDDSLSVNPSLWSSVQAGLDGSEFFVLLASPEAAKSDWVEKEVAYWLSIRPAANLLIVVTDGEIAWNDEDGDFDRERTTCLPPALYGAFRDEPRWADLSTVRHEEDLSLRLPAFQDCVADLAAALRHLPKDEIVGDDLTQHRRTRRHLTAGVVTLALVTVAAVVAALVAANHARVADEQRRIAEDRQRAAVARELEARSRESLAHDPRTALRLAVAAHDVHPDRESEANLHRALTGTAYAGAFSGQATGDRQGFFPDGAAFVTSGGGQVVIWDVRSSPPVRLASFPAEGTPVVSPDGKTIVISRVAAAGQRSVGIWSLWDVSDRAHPVQTGQSHQVGQGAGGPPVFSPDGRLLATTGWTDEGSSVVHLWDITDRERPRVHQRLTAQASSVAFAPDGRTLAVGYGRRGDFHADMVIELWNVAAPTGPARLSTKTFTSGGVVRSLAFSRDGGLLVAGGNGPQGDTRVAAVLVDVTDPRRPAQLGQAIAGQRSSTMVAALSPTAPVLATSAGQDNAIVLWDISDRSTPRLIHTLSGHTSMVRWIAFAPDGHQLISGDDDETIQWRPPGRTSPPVSAVAASDPLIHQMPQPSAVAVSPDGKTLLTGNPHNNYLVWDIEDRTRPRRLSTLSLQPHRFTSGPPAMSPDGRMVAIGGSSADPGHDEVLLWDITDRASPRLVSRIPARDLSRLRTLAFAPDGRTLAVGGGDWLTGLGPPREGKLDLWNVEDSSRPAHLVHIASTGVGGQVLSVSFSADGGLLAAGGAEVTSADSGSAVLWDVRNPRQPRRIGQALSGHTGPVNAVAIAPDGRTLATGGGHLPKESGIEGEAILWDITKPEQPGRIGQPLIGHQGPVAAVAFAPNGLLVTAGGTGRYDHPGVVRLWDVTDLPRVHPIGHSFTAHNGTVHAAAFSSAGSLLTSGGLSSGDGSVVTAALWDLTPLTRLRADLRGRACAIAGGGLDEQEWARYVPGLPVRKTCSS